MTSQDYQILDLTPEASLEEIKRAYRRLTLLYHPDKCGGDTTIFQKVKKAYRSVLAIKTGKGECFTHDEFKKHYKEQLDQQEKIIQIDLISEKNKCIKEKSGDLDGEHTCDLVNEFDLKKFNQVFERNNTGTRDKEEKLVDSIKVNMDQYLDSYKSFVPNKKNILGEDALLSNPDSFAEAFNTQFEHLNRDQKRSLKEYTGDPEPVIGGFTIQNASFTKGDDDSDDTKIRKQTGTTTVSGNLLWSGGLEQGKFASLCKSNVLELAKNPEDKRHLLNKIDCEQQVEKLRRENQNPDLQTTMSKLEALRAERRAALLATAKSLTKLSCTRGK